MPKIVVIDPAWENAEIISAVLALHNGTWPKGTRLCVCSNQGVKANVVARAWWGYPILGYYGANLQTKRVGYDKEKATLSMLKVKFAPLFAS